MKEIICLSNFKDFKCKCSNCRNTCCKLWNISLSAEEYFRIQNLKCEPELKSKIENAFSVLEDATLERYAIINLKYNGLCPLIDNNHMCSLQKECGEMILPQVCVNYPRSLRRLHNYEGVLTNSCECVVENLIEGNKLQIEKNNISDKFITNVNHGLVSPNYEEIRSKCINLLQDRTYKIEDRLMNILYFLETIEQEECKYPFKFFNEEFLNYLKEIILVLGKRSTYLFKYNEVALKIFETNNIDEILNKDTEYLLKHKEYNLAMENILINHIFYENFPFVYGIGSFYEAFNSLATVYGLTTFLVIANDPKDKDSFVDLIAYLFRLIEHSNFYNNCKVIASKYLKKK